VAALNGGDAGLQPERTALAWSRTALALLANALLALRCGLEGHDTLVTLMGLLLLLAAGAGLLCSTWRRRELAQARALGAPPQWMMSSTVAVTWLAALAGVLAVASHWH
jgi:uncharacterized membrane protein YidH (DUF202 family)